MILQTAIIFMLINEIVEQTRPFLLQWWSRHIGRPILSAVVEAPCHYDSDFGSPVEELIQTSTLFNSILQDIMPQRLFLKNTIFQSANLNRSSSGFIVRAHQSAHISSTGSFNIIAIRFGEKRLMAIGI